MKTIDTEKNKRIRIVILNLLKTEYPRPLDLKVLQFSLDNLGFTLLEHALCAHLNYLQGKGFVEMEKRGDYGIQIVFAQLTPKGWDLIDGNISETGIAEL